MCSRTSRRCRKRCGAWTTLCFSRTRPAPRWRRGARWPIWCSPTWRRILPDGNCHQRWFDRALRRETWFVSYGLLGLTQNGLVPVLMPLVAPSGAAAGLTYAAFSLLGLLAPVLGSWADYTGRHRDLLIWGSICGGLMLLPFPWVSEPVRIVLAAGAGFGTMATTTAGNVLAIQDV